MAEHPQRDGQPGAMEEDALLDESMNDKSEIAEGEVRDETALLARLSATARDQDDIERTIGQQAEQMLTQQADERDQKRLEKTLSDRQKLTSQMQKLERRIKTPLLGATASERLKSELEHLRPQLDNLTQDLVQIQARMTERHQKEAEEGEETAQSGNQRLPGETRRDFLIRTGKITPFSRMGAERTSSNLAEVMLEAEEQDDTADGEDDGTEQVGIHRSKNLSHRNLLRPGFDSGDASHAESAAEKVKSRPRKRRRISEPEAVALGAALIGHADKNDAPGDTFVPNAEVSADDVEDDDSDYGLIVQGGTQQKRTAKQKRLAKRDSDERSEDETQDLTGVDDGDENLYQARVRKWTERRRLARQKAQDNFAANGDGSVTADVPMDGETGVEEWCQPHPSRADHILAGGLRIPGDIYPSLFDYQKTGVQWLSELYEQEVGGIVGDEMGLGKTIQLIAFLAGLHHSNRLKKPVIVVAPVTVMKQWVNEFHTWWPPLRVSILHSSGSGMVDMRKESRLEDELESRTPGRVKLGAGGAVARRIVNRVVNHGHVLITSYSGLQSYAELLIPVDWDYAVLDEGHKIRNPNAGITIFCKELRTPNRVILSGTPMQNNLTELWSLFDFIFPMRLGTLVNFRTQFEIPIKQGGYANASNLQVETALKCAETLKDAISPYLLQRFKVDVAADLPKKSEQVLFCRLTKQQREAYEAFLGSDELSSILRGKRQALFGIDMLRKICNHPDLQDHKVLSIKGDYDYGNGVKSGKMQVVKALLELWRDTGHKTLLFSQQRIMLDILERFVKKLGGINYCRMDGTTLVKDRQDIVDDFNSDPNLHVFLLTTKVGGLGVNLTGADRVIIYDPDWNPSTDMQARERSWRLGQTREVMIYRLMTAGTIEEKIYHRQIFKQFLTNKILRDPKQRQTFHLKDLHDLFTLGDQNEPETETGSLFQGAEVQFAAENESLNAREAQETVEDSQKLNAISGISHRERFQAPNEHEPSPDKRDESDISNPRLLSSIFARSGVQSALEHDAIINGTSSGALKLSADPTIIAREAKRVAAKAAQQLQRAGEAARAIPAGTPTWTGQFGVAGRPEEFLRSRLPNARGNGPGSSSILSNLAHRQGAASPSPTASSTPRSGSEPRGRDFMEMIRDFLLAHGGSVPTQMLIDHFNRYCRTEERTAEFKEMLRAIAVLNRGEQGAAAWSAGAIGGSGGVEAEVVGSGGC